jgi:E3 ubiquitin-protein ligase MARCH6
VESAVSLGPCCTSKPLTVSTIPSRDPLSEIPVDLLFLQIVVPPTLPHFQPGTFLLSMVARLWLVLARRLRLTSYMFGERRAEEESSTPWPWSDSTVRTRDGVFARAPAGDNIVFTQDKHVLVTTTEQGDPISEAGKALVEAQDAVARKAGRDPKDDYTIIYLPPHFSRRVLTFIFLLWLVGVSFAALAIGAPILTGRAIFAMTMPKQIHDGYSFIAGFYVLWGAFLIPPTVIPWYRHQRIIAAIDRSSYPLKVAIRSVSWIFQITWLAISLGFIIPLLLAIVLELYIIFPLRAGIFPSDTVPTIRLWEDWALGLIVTKIALKLQRLQPPGKYMRAIDTVSVYTHS